MKSIYQIYADTFKVRSLLEQPKVGLLKERHSQLLKCPLLKEVCPLKNQFALSEISPTLKLIFLQLRLLTILVHSLLFSQATQMV